MKYKGKTYSLAKHLSFRHANEQDINQRGKKIQRNYLIPVKISSCKTYQENGQTYLDTKTAPQAYIISHTRTNLCRGYYKPYNISKPRFVSLNSGVWTTVFPESELWKATEYLCYGGKVYTRAVYSLEKPSSIYIDPKYLL